MIFPAYPRPSNSPIRHPAVQAPPHAHADISFQVHGWHPPLFDKRIIPKMVGVQPDQQLGRLNQLIAFHQIDQRL